MIWRDGFLRWPEFKALERCAGTLGKPPEYIQHHIEVLHELEKSAGPLAVRSAILDLHRRLHESEWDSA